MGMLSEQDDDGEAREVRERYDGDSVDVASTEPGRGFSRAEEGAKLGNMEGASCIEQRWSRRRFSLRCCIRTDLHLPPQFPRQPLEKAPDFPVLVAVVPSY